MSPGCLFYRDGVSEGQFYQVLLHELRALWKVTAPSCSSYWSDIFKFKFATDPSFRLAATYTDQAPRIKRPSQLSGLCHLRDGGTHCWHSLPRLYFEGLSAVKTSICRP